MENDTFIDVCVLPSRIQNLTLQTILMQEEWIEESNSVVLTLTHGDQNQQWWAPPQFLIQWFWGGAREFAFPVNSQILLLLV